MAKFNLKQARIYEQAVVPKSKVQIKQQYLNSQFIHDQIGIKTKGNKTNAKHSRLNHSMIYDQVKYLNDSKN